MLAAGFQVLANPLWLPLEGFLLMVLMISLFFIAGLAVGWLIATRRYVSKLKANSIEENSGISKCYTTTLKHSLEHLPLAVFVISTDGNLLFANSTCRKLFPSFSSEELLNLKRGISPSWIHPKDNKNIAEIYSTLKNLKIGTLETKVRIKNDSGEWIHLKLTLFSDHSSDTPVSIANENEHRIFGICEDVTLFQTVIQALKDRESRTKRLLSGVRDAAILVLCEDGFIQFCNDSVESVLKYTESELKGQHISVLSPRTELLSGKTLNTFSHADACAYHQETSRRLRKDGTGFWANVLVTSLPAESPYGKNYCVVIRDISSYKREEKELHEWKKRFEQLAENVKEAFWIYDIRSASLVYVSPVFKPLLDINPNTSENFFSEILRKIHPTDLTLARTFMSDLTLGHDADVEFRVMSSNKQIQWLRFKSFAVRDLTNRVYRVVGVAEDVTESKTNQFALRKAKEDADAANKAKSEFLANMSHEIRTPLGAMMGFAELMGDAHNSESDRTSALQAIMRNGRQLSKIIDEILDLSKVEAGKLELEEEEIDVLGFIADVTTLLSLQAKEKGIDLRIEPNGLLPKTIRTDGTKFRQILINIIGNAVKFTSRGAVTISVSSELNAQDSILRLTITDTGPGLDQAQQSRLFQPFVQADSSTRRRFGGTGLGLVLSRRLAQLLGGDLRLQWSRPDVGSCFEISINIGAAKNLKLTESFNSQSTSRTQSIQSQSVPRLDGKKILVVDDAPDNRLIVQRFLTHAGAHVAHAEDGLRGAKMALESDFDLIVMDIQMPEFDGYQTIGYLREHGFDKPVLALSAHAMREDRERSLASGFDEHMSKPVNRQELLSRISFLLDLPKSSFLPNCEKQ